MKELHVSLLITTALLDLATLSKRLGCEPSSGSHDRDAPRVGGRPAFEKTIWRLDSSAPKSAPLMKHCENISTKLSAKEILNPGRLPQDAKIYLDIATFFIEASCTVNIPMECVDFAMRYHAEIEVSCYPSN